MSIVTFYHGTNEGINKFTDQDNIFITSDLDFVERFGVFIYSLKVDLGNIFDSTNINHIQKLYDVGFKIRDPYLDSDWDDMDYDFEKDEYPSAKSFINSPHTRKNSWNGIELTDGVIDWIFDNGYNSILLTEDYIKNYLIKKEQISDVKLYYIIED
jgi:hypothetical protein